ncbi:MAG: twin-arginine translocase TatA/TatE family subunit [Chloroflexi bacterium]|nr:twin-arginine translocase TatA/TatE family subunit [Chloroflexota bacterium]MDA1297524.1 twin-arginine translocase TatA/TatE family subunit [Chloroflexota bacterium]
MGFIKGIGPLEIFLILVVIMIIFGVGKLPSVGKGMGQALKEFRSSVKDKDEGEKKLESAESKAETKAESKVS